MFFAILRRLNLEKITATQHFMVYITLQQGQELFVSFVGPKMATGIALDITGGHLFCNWRNLYAYAEIGKSIHSISNYTYSNTYGNIEQHIWQHRATHMTRVSINAQMDIFMPKKMSKTSKNDC